MKQSTLLPASIFIAVVVCLLTACAVRKSEPITGVMFTPATAAIAHGEAVYMAHCQKCHPAGEGGLGPALNSNPAPGFIKRFQMRHGLGVMPGFKKDEISKSDLHDISKYMKAWKRYN